jgi:hypothetical protein
MAAASTFSPSARAGREKQQHDEAAELVKEDRKAGACLDRRQSVGTVLRVSPRRLGAAQALRDVGPQALRRLLDGERVPGGFVVMQLSDKR